MSKNKHKKVGRFNQPPRAKFTPVKPQSENQRQYLKAIYENDIIFCRGYAGSGKSLLALSACLSLLYDREQFYERLIVVRPYIKTNFQEDFGALPGTSDEKLLPFVNAIIDNLLVVCTKEEAQRLIHYKEIDFTILSMLRGRSFNNALVIVEEAQNVPNIDAFKMLTSRIGNNSKLIMCGDTNQCDLAGESVFWKTAKFLEGIEGIAICEMLEYADIVRNPIVREILKRFNKMETDNG